MFDSLATIAIFLSSTLVQLPTCCPASLLQRLCIYGLYGAICCYYYYYYY